MERIATMACGEENALMGPSKLNRALVKKPATTTRSLGNLTLLLAAEFDVVATAADSKSALDLIRRYKPDLVVLDLGRPVLIASRSPEG